MTKDEIMALVDQIIEFSRECMFSQHRAADLALSAALDEVFAERDAALEGWRCECSTEDACRFARERDAAIAERDALKEALRDMLSGWIYIRQTHGDLYGVGWDRAQDKAIAAMKGTS